MEYTQRYAIRCSCNKPLCDVVPLLIHGLKNNKNWQELMKELGINKECCQRTLLSPSPFNFAIQRYAAVFMVKSEDTLPPKDAPRPSTFERCKIGFENNGPDSLELYPEIFYDEVKPDIYISPPLFNAENDELVVIDSVGTAQDKKTINKGMKVGVPAFPPTKTFTDNTYFSGDNAYPVKVISGRKYLAV